MRSLVRHGWIRYATLFLLAWISVDLGLPELCARNAFDWDCTAPSLSHSDDGSPEHNGLLHPDHCFCHAHSITLSARVLLDQSPQSSALDTFRVRFSPAAALAQLYHPPQPSL